MTVTYKIESFEGDFNGKTYWMVEKLSRGLLFKSWGEEGRFDSLGEAEAFVRARATRRTHTFFYNAHGEKIERYPGP
jgi:hypothetical protein